MSRQRLHYFVGPYQAASLLDTNYLPCQPPPNPQCSLTWFKASSDDDDDYDDDVSDNDVSDDDVSDGYDDDDDVSLLLTHNVL